MIYSTYPLSVNCVHLYGQYLFGTTACLAQITALTWCGIEGNQLVTEAQIALMAAFSSSVFLGRVVLIFLLTIPRHILYGV